MQKGRTVDFWDAFYESEGRRAQHQGRDEDGAGHLEGEGAAVSPPSPSRHPTKEWILQPSAAVLELLCRQLVSPRRASRDAGPTPTRIDDSALVGREQSPRVGSGRSSSSSSSSSTTTLRYLEIGAGTSCLSRELFRYLLEDRLAKEASKNLAESPRGGVQQPRLSALATDVSAVCIEQNRRRDASFLEEAGDSFRYSTLNVESAPPADLRGSFDFVLDKGCLDTLLFRTRHRGGRRKDILVQTALDNLYTMLKDEAHCCLLILSPRSKLRPLREHPGFACERHGLDRAAFGLAAGDLSAGNKIGGREALYLHACRRRPGYDPAAASPSVPQTDCYDGLLSDDDACPACAATFLAFRGGHQSLAGRGKKVWVRQWTGHKAHCKG